MAYFGGSADVHIHGEYFVVGGLQLSHTTDIHFDEASLLRVQVDPLWRDVTLKLSGENLPHSNPIIASESLLGLIPPEIFIAWSDKATSPILALSLLALLSYLGGVVSFFIGKSITKIPAVHNYLEVKMAKHIKNTRKWGGFLIIVGALLPIPFSMTSIAAGMINFPFGSYLAFGLLRFLRFYLYAIAIFSLV